MALSVETHLREAKSLLEQGRYDLAAQHYRNILERYPQHQQAIKGLEDLPPSTFLNSEIDRLGSLYQQRQFETVLNEGEVLVERYPNSWALHNIVGSTLHSLGRLEEAVEQFSLAVKYNPEDALRHYNLGVVLYQLEKLEEALVSYTKALQLNPNDANSHFNMGKALNDLGRLTEAVNSYRRAIALKPDYVEAYFNLGNTLGASGNVQEAISSYEAILKLKPDLLVAYINLGQLYERVRQFDRALELYDRALQLQPDAANVRFNRALLLLACGNFAQGWPDFGVYCVEQKKPPVDTPLYAGGSLADQHLLLLSDQGVGDEVMYASLLPEVVSQAGMVTFVCEPRLARLFSRSFNGVNVISGQEVREHVDEFTGIDGYLSIASLPRYYRGSLRSFSRTGAYLQADPQKVRWWQGQLAALGEGQKIGISWRGGSEPHLIKRRSIGLDQWLPIFSLPNTVFISLQYGECRDELTEFSARTGKTIHHWQDADPLVDLDEFAAQVKALDRVISIDNTTVHISAALGLQTEVLLPNRADWRWLHDRDDSPWYPGVMRLFRQKTEGDWQEVIAHLAAVLASESI